MYTSFENIVVGKCLKGQNSSMPFAAGIPVTRTNMAKAITSFGWMINAQKPKLPFSQKQNLESN